MTVKIFESNEMKKKKKECICGDCGKYSKSLKRLLQVVVPKRVDVVDYVCEVCYESYN